MANNMICKICGNDLDNKTFIIKERMFGYGDEFPYIECSKCGCLQIEEVPKNMDKYYPNGYYSFQSGATNKNFLKDYLISELYKYFLFKNSFIGKVLSKRYPMHNLNCIGLVNVNRDSKILDVGCGSGTLLQSLRKIGFNDLIGIDPYIDYGTSTNYMRILKADICDLPDSPKFDLIMFNHSFEHMYNPQEVLIKVRSLLKQNGKCLISIPVKTKWVWDKYGVNWVQIDAPRHFFLYTSKSFNLLSEESGLEIFDVIFNSDEFLFWGSEQYIKNIPLNSDASYSKNKKKSIFSKNDIKNFRSISKRLNMNKEGDSATFFLKI